MQIKRHNCGLPPHTMLDPHPIRVDKRNKNFFTYFPGLSSELLQIYLTKKQSTILGNLQQPQKILRSTHKKELQSAPEPEPDQFPPPAQSEGTYLVFLKKVDLTGKTYTDQTGRSPITSRKGKKYILVAYHYD